ncbi:MAG: isochorismatase family cysteine hydrolase [Burkholderiaceae bacterium]
MHPLTIPQEIVDRMMTRRGHLHLFDSLVPARTALVVIDMQCAFLEPGAPSETPMAREIVPQINRLAKDLRAQGGVVAFAQGSFQAQGPDAWPLFFDYMVNAQHSKAILDALTPGRPGHALWPGLDVQAQDLRVRKNRYSAFFPGACALPDLLRARAIDTVLITGTLTNVCCEASARDAMMGDFKTIMVSDANAARSDAEHNAALATLMQFFADVRSTEEVIGLLQAAR